MLPLLIRPGELIRPVSPASHELVQKSIDLKLFDFTFHHNKTPRLCFFLELVRRQHFQIVGCDCVHGVVQCMRRHRQSSEERIKRCFPRSVGSYAPCRELVVAFEAMRHTETRQGTGNFHYFIEIILRRIPEVLSHNLTVIHSPIWCSISPQSPESSAFSTP